MNSIALYEKKVIRDREFPVQLHTHHIQTRGEYFNSHWHEHLEIHYIRQGSGYFRLDQEKYPIAPGTAVIANSNVLHQGVCETLPLVDDRIIFSISDISPELGAQNPVFQSVVSGDAVIDRIFAQLLTEWQDKQIGYKQSCKALVTELLVHLYRHYVVELLTKEDSIRRKKIQERLNQVLVYIDFHYGEPIGNQELADMVYLSKDRFEHFFRENMGMPPLQYINQLRLKKALGLMQQENLTITDIAQMVGFNDYNHFGRQFRKFYGCTPNEMKRKQKSGIV